MINEESELLRRYADERAEAAFAAIVRRHIGLVYHAALRQTGDATLAEEVTQTVFTDLARKAGALAGRASITGWLYTSTRFAAAKARRGEQRRRAREQEVYAMQTTATDGAGDLAAEADWEQLRPVIDEALQALEERDRDAVLLRFFEGRPLAEVGAKLAMSEDAARKRVARALDKLQGLLARRGITSTTAALGVAMGAQAGVAAPAGLAASVTAGAVVAGVAGPNSAATGILTFMSTTKTGLGVLGLLVIFGVGLLVSQLRTNAELRQEIATLRELADHARPALSAPLTVPRAPSNPLGQPTVVATSLEKDAVGDDRRLSRERGAVRVEDWQNRGTATPSAALESYLWAVDQVDVDVTAMTIGFGEWRSKVDAFFATLSEEVRAKYDTPEKLWALIMTGAPHGPRIVSFELLAETRDASLPNADNYRSLRVRTVKEDGKIEQGDIRFQLTPNGWRRSLDDRAESLIAPMYRMWTPAKKPAGSQ